MTTLRSFPGSLRLLGALLALLLLGCATPSTPPPSSALEADAVVIKKSAIDTRSYRHRVLPNGLEVLLVSDLASDQAAAALAVDVGSFAEPESHLGLAHFLEHMLFLGTEKFPDPDGYGDFISRNGGDRNAYTALDHTNYFFSIRPEAFFEGLDRFAQFFIAPRFDAAYVSRERNAVHSEYQMQLKNDGWRTYMTQKRALNPAHPGSRFTIGSLDTLADDEPGALREALLAFYEAHYSADRMRLVLLAPESLDTLESWATELFGPVRARPTAVNEPEAPVFAKDQLPSLLRIRPVKERRSLELTFPLPPLDPYQAEAPGAYLANLLGHEGEGSAHAVLKDAGLINGLSAGAAPFGEHNALFSIAVDLTEAGYAQWPQVTGTLFAAIERLRAEGPQRWRYDEQARLAALAFAYQPQRDAYNTVSALAAGLLEVPPEEILRSGMRMDRFDPVLLESILAALRPDRLQLTL
ncbi:MAG: insulinase family protein, partial [Pseudomonadales bacterium]